MTLRKRIEWFDEERGLPAFRFLDGFPVREVDAAGKPAAYSDDPVVLVGNEALTLFARLSGELWLLSGQRGWAGLNFSGRANHGANSARIHFGEREMDLIGHPDTRMNAGVGFAEWITETAGLRMVRRVACDAGYAPRLRFQTRIESMSADALPYRLEEAVTGNYVPLSLQRKPPEEWPLRYAARRTGGDTAIRFERASTRFALDAGGERLVSMYDTDPPVLRAEGKGCFVDGTRLGARMVGVL